MIFNYIYIYIIYKYKYINVCVRIYTTHIHIHVRSKNIFFLTERSKESFRSYVYDHNNKTYRRY